MRRSASSSAPCKLPAPRHDQTELDGAMLAIRFSLRSLEASGAKFDKQLGRQRLAQLAHNMHAGDEDGPSPRETLRRHLDMRSKRERPALLATFRRGVTPDGAEREDSCSSGSCGDGGEEDVDCEELAAKLAEAGSGREVRVAKVRPLLMASVLSFPPSAASEAGRLSGTARGISAALSFPPSVPSRWKGRWSRPSSASCGVQRAPAAPDGNASKASTGPSRKLGRAATEPRLAPAGVAPARPCSAQHAMPRQRAKTAADISTSQRLGSTTSFARPISSGLNT